MTDYTAPVADMRFVLDELCDLPGLAALPPYEEATPDLVDQVLNGAGRIASEVLAPLNQSGDRERSRLENGVVRTPSGFADAYRAFAEGGWIGLPFEAEIGGAGLPWVLATAVNETVQASNMGFGLCPLLTFGAVEALAAHGSDELKAIYLPRMVSGEWTGTVNLTEPQAGSDLSALRTRAGRDGARYRITGQKIYITYGEQDFTENIVHLVLARLPDAPAGTRGISLFLVPKVMVENDGSLGAHNDVRCVGLEDKLGIHASPTAVMSYGDDGGAVGYLIGEENNGLACMFTMMNNARLNVGLQGVAIADRAYQQAVDYARTRVQSKPITGGDAQVPIVRHADVRRMLMSMRSQVEAMRALTYYACAQLDRAKVAPDVADRAAAQARVDLLTPIVKAWCTDLGVEIASTGVQVHGGMGYVEETGAAQHLRDARIAPIYEGTNGIQANDLVGRKVLRDDGATMTALIDEIAALDGPLGKAGEGFASIRTHLAEGRQALLTATHWVVDRGAQEPETVYAGAAPYLRLAGSVAAGWLMARAGLAAAGRRAEGTGDPAFLDAKVATARFFAEHVLPLAPGLALTVTHGGGSVLALDEDAL